MTKKAFTLIELLIVVAIIGILAAIAVPNLMNAQIRAKVGRMENDLETVVDSLDMYYMDNGCFPHGGGIGLSVLTTPVAYLTAMPIDVFRDPNSNSFGSRELQYMGWCKSYILLSVGPNGDPYIAEDYNVSNGVMSHGCIRKMRKNVTLSATQWW